MGERSCRSCGRMFMPSKANHYYCRWGCYLADHPEASEGESRPTPPPRAGERGGIPEPLWSRMVRLCHPDRWQGTILEQDSHEVMVWLNTHRPGLVAAGRRI